MCMYMCACVSTCVCECMCVCVCMVLHTQTHVPLDIECVVIITSMFSSVTVSSWYMYTVVTCTFFSTHVFFHKLCQHTENFRRVEYLQDGPSPLGLVGGVATIGVLHLQQLSKGVQRCTKVSRYVQRCASVCRGAQIM